MKELARSAVGYFLIGIVLCAGMKTADWIIPDPPRKPIQIEWKDDA